jgi:sodium transport system ATP-binding protein
MIEIKAICKSFKRRGKKRKGKKFESEPALTGSIVHALTDVTFTAEKGKILGLLGQNGAGKTTLLRILATSLKPTSGTALFDGIDILRNPIEVRRRIGFLSDNTGLYGRLTGREMIEYFGLLHGIERRTLKNRVAELIDLLSMKDFIDKRNDTLSSGMKQKVSIARTLVHDPQIVMFDEPTTGLDVVAAEAILQFIESCRQKGKTVLFCTHHMHEVERLCDKIVMLRQGQICFTGTTKQMLEQTGQEHLDKAFLSIVGSGGQINA